MSDSIHGHEIIDFVTENSNRFTRTSLVEDIHQRHGADIRFHTCSASDLTAVQLIDFLVSHDKFVESSEGLLAPTGLRCDH